MHILYVFLLSLLCKSSYSLAVLYIGTINISLKLVIFITNLLQSSCLVDKLFLIFYDIKMM